MPQPKTFEYYLRKKTSPSTYEYYYIDSVTGVVSLQISPIEINFAPQGWDEKALQWKRGFDWWGVFTEFSLPLKFVKDGAKILRYVLYNEGGEGNCELLIKRLNKTTWAYEDYYIGGLDFTKSNDENSFFTINILASGYIDKLKSRESQEYEIDLDTLADFYVKVDGITLLNDFNYILGSGVWDVPKGHMVIGMDRYYSGGNIGLDNFVSVQADPEFAGISPLYDSPDTRHVITYVKALTLDISYTINFQCDTLPGVNYFASDFYMYVVHKNNLGVTQSLNLIYSSLFVSMLGIPQSVTGTINNLNLVNGDILYLLCYNTTSVAFAFTMNANSTYDINAEITLPETYTKALRPQTVFAELVDKISDGEVGTDDLPLYDLKEYVLTSGDALRQLSGAKLKTSFSDFFDSYNNAFDLGTYYNKNDNRHYIKYKRELFDATVNLTNIGAVANLKVTPFSELNFSKLTNGYNNYDYDDLNGRGEFNTKFNLLSPMTRVTAERSLIVPYRADMYGIEFTRYNLEGKTTVDGKSDNDVFILNIENTSAGTHLGLPYYNLYRDVSLTIFGLIFSDTAYNINLSPKRNLLRNGDWLRSLLFGLENKFIEFTSADKNADMVTDDGVNLIYEKAFEIISDLDTPLFQPFVLEFECVQPINIQVILDNYPYGYIEFDWNGETYKGFLIEANDNPAFNQKQTLKLLSLTSNNLTNFIK